MQRTLAFLEPSPSCVQQTPSRRTLDAEARAVALNILARMIAQACQSNQTNGDNR